MRKKWVKRMGQRFVISGELMQNVTEYKYLGCVINEHVESKVMVDSWGRAGARALCVWLRRCMQGSCWRGARGVINFVKLLEAMVESLLLYGAGVWGC